jgi:hypothetical protein
MEVIPPISFNYNLIYMLIVMIYLLMSELNELWLIWCFSDRQKSLFDRKGNKIDGLLKRRTRQFVPSAGIMKLTQFHRKTTHHKSEFG